MIIIVLLFLEIKSWVSLNTRKTGIEDEFHLLSSMLSSDKYRVQINAINYLKWENENTQIKFIFCSDSSF